MTDPQTRTALEQRLNSARITFNLARASLKTTLGKWKPREGAVDRIIHYAEEFGIEHTLEQLVATPQLFDLGAQPSKADISDIRSGLYSAQAAHYLMDRAMAAREAMLTADNPTHVNAIIVGGREVELHPDKGLMRYRDNGQSEPLQLREVERDRPDAEHDHDHEDDRRR